MPRERAAGYILYRLRGGKREYLLIKNRQGGHWGFPKGKVEPGEGVEEAARAGVTAIVQPGGSKGDASVIEAANAHGLAMLFTGVRHFRH